MCFVSVWIPNKWVDNEETFATFLTDWCMFHVTFRLTAWESNETELFRSLLSYFDGSGSMSSCIDLPAFLSAVLIFQNTAPNILAVFQQGFHVDQIHYMMQEILVASLHLDFYNFSLELNPLTKKT